MSELNWSIIWMLVVLMVATTICGIVILAMRDMTKDNSLQRKIKEREAFGGDGDGRPGMG